MRIVGQRWKNAKIEKTEMRDRDFGQMPGGKSRKEDGKRDKKGKKEKENIRRIITATAFLGLYILLCTACGLMQDEKIKLRDLDFTVLSEEKIPEELKTVIAGKGIEPFKLTYSDNQNLYISIGYGEQKTGGYSIAVDELYLTDDAIYVGTSLLGPDITGQKENTGKPSVPYIVLKTELLDKTVIYE